MHISRVLNARWQRRSLPNTTSAGIGTGSTPSGEPSGACNKIAVWILAISAFLFAVLGIGVFEATRLTSHVLRSNCTVVRSKVVDVGTCTTCDSEEAAAACETHPVATAMVSVTFRPSRRTKNVTGVVWLCKGHRSTNPCNMHQAFSDQMHLDSVQIGGFPVGPSARPGHCSIGEVFRYLQDGRFDEGEVRECYYSSRDPVGEDVWFSMPPPGLVDHVWFDRHTEYPLLLAVGGLVLLSTLLGCLALEGAEMWAAGL